VGTAGGFDRLDAERTAGSVLEVRYARSGPTDRELRLIGDAAGLRTLDLGTGSGQAAIALARRGATSIAIDTSAARIASAQRAAERSAVRVEWHTGDLSELAFLSADSIDLVFSAYALGAVEDLDRLFRQVHRVLRPGGRFVFSYEHPIATALRAQRSAFDDAPLLVERDGAQTAIHLHPIGTVLTALGRAGFRVDTIIEPRPTASAGETALLPSTIVWRAKKEGV